MKEANKLGKIIQSGKRLIIFLHNNPDPDGIASGWLLKGIAKHLGVPSRIVYGGQLARAENRTMVKLLKIPLQSLEEKSIRLQGSDRIALLDTQPNTGNNAFPADSRKCHIVIDHHPAKKKVAADYVDVRTEDGCTTTLLLEYFRSFSLTMEPALATACTYAIASETQDLGREATRADREAFSQLSSLVQLGVLGKIRHPVRKREYYRAIAKAMQNVLVAQNTCICHIGEVHSAEMVAELADFFVAMERVTWCLVTGWHRDTMVLSIRTTNTRARAEMIMRRMLGRLGKGGGHGMMAGGAIPCGSSEKYNDYKLLVSKRFSERLCRKSNEVFKPLLEPIGAAEQLSAVRRPGRADTNSR